MGFLHDMTKQTFLLFGAGMLTLSIGHWWWRRSIARDIAERWLGQHHYRIRRFRTVYWSGHPRFRISPFRNDDSAFDFSVEVDDIRLGGTGDVRLRVWTDWLGMIDREPEIAWDRMPTEENGGARAVEDQWVDAQTALLRRAAAGESTFRPSRNDLASRAEFDATVEHALALQRRGLLKCSTPLAELKIDAQYAALTGVEITDEGRRALERADAPKPDLRTI
jgi:hypothetical protein